MVTSLSKLIVPAAAMVIAALTAPLTANSIVQPRLYDDSDYNEYWEQQFLFNNGTMVTSQFLIANFPFSKQHGLMVATLTKPGAETIIVKNGRKRSGWKYDQQEPQLSIYQHELSGTYPDYHANLNNTAAEVDIRYLSSSEPIPLTLPKNKLGLPEISLYAPTATATGRWRAGPEIGGDGDTGEWEDLGAGAGYGLHVVQRSSLNHSIHRWQRFTALSGTGAYQPILHAFETPKGDEQAILILLPEEGTPIRFSNVKLTQNEKDKSWKVAATTEGAILTGTVQPGKVIENFLLQDHLNALEQIVAGSLADIARRRYTATYDMTLTVNGQKTQIKGTMLAENILLGKEKKKKRRSRR